jgi:hypothetical protein
LGLYIRPLSGWGSLPLLHISFEIFRVGLV